MKPFNLEQAKQGKKVVTRFNKDFTFGGYNPNAIERQRVFGWVDGKAITVGVDGLEYTAVRTTNDLFMATENKTVWVNVYESQLGNTAYDVSHAYDTKNLAIANGRTHRKEYIGTYPIEIEV